MDFLCLPEYKDTFGRHDVRGGELLHLERRDLKVARRRRRPFVRKPGARHGQIGDTRVRLVRRTLAWARWAT